MRDKGTRCAPKSIGAMPARECALRIERQLPLYAEHRCRDAMPMRAICACRATLPHAGHGRRRDIAARRICEKFSRSRARREAGCHDTPIHSKRSTIGYSSRARALVPRRHRQVVRRPAQKSRTPYYLLLLLPATNFLCAPRAFNGHSLLPRH